MVRLRLIQPVRLILALVALMLSSCIRIPASAEAQRLQTLSKRTPVSRESIPSQDDTVIVWMIADTLHTGMVFPYDWLVENGLRPPPNFPKANYVSMSWGNREAYVQTAWLTPWQAVRAMCFPSPSVMEMIPFDYDVVPVCHEQRIWKSVIPRDRGRQVAEFLNGCVRYDAEGNPIIVGPSSWGVGILMESRWSYYIPRVCNVWTAQAIEACGGEMHLWGTMTANGIIRQAEKNGFQMIWNAYDKPTEKKDS
jgi:hypothetical protein